MKQVDDRDRRRFARQHGVQLANVGIGKAEIGKKNNLGAPALLSLTAHQNKKNRACPAFLDKGEPPLFRSGLRCLLALGRFLLGRALLGLGGGFLVSLRLGGFFRLGFQSGARFGDRFSRRRLGGM